MEYTNSYVNLPEHWGVLNSKVYNIEEKFLSLTTMLSLYKGDFSYHCRRINGKKAAQYTYRLACSLKYKNRLILRVYHEPDSDKTIYKVFPQVGDLPRKMEQLKSEEQLDEILEKCMTYILNENWAYGGLYRF